MVKNDTGVDIQKTNKTEKSMGILEDAVARMEQAVKARPANSVAEDESKEMAELRHSNASLKEANAVVAQRLDGAINQLKTILES